VPVSGQPGRSAGTAPRVDSAQSPAARRQVPGRPVRGQRHFSASASLPVSRRPACSSSSSPAHLVRSRRAGDNHVSRGEIELRLTRPGYQSQPQRGAPAPPVPRRLPVPLRCPGRPDSAVPLRHGLGRGRAPVAGTGFGTAGASAVLGRRGSTTAPSIGVPPAQLFGRVHHSSCRVGAARREDRRIARLAGSGRPRWPRRGSVDHQESASSGAGRAGRAGPGTGAGHRHSRTPV